MNNYTIICIYLFIYLLKKKKKKKIDNKKTKFLKFFKTKKIKRKFGTTYFTNCVKKSLSYKKWKEINII